MTTADLIEMLDFNRGKTLAFLDNLAKLDGAAKALAWRPGPGRAHIAWQLMHIAATDDRHVHVRMAPPGGQPKNAAYVGRFAGGSTPDDEIPSIDEIKRYLAEQRTEVVNYLKSLPTAALATKPTETAPWTHNEWVKVLAWHEAHHQGQAHLTLNLYKAAHGIK